MCTAIYPAGNSVGGSGYNNGGVTHESAFEIPELWDFTFERHK
jgi:hypothetical protein